MTLTRGRWRLVGTAVMSAALVAVGIAGIWSASNVLVPIGVGLFGLAAGSTSFDRVIVDATRVRNVRAMPIGGFSTPVSDVRAVGVGMQIMGFQAPTIVTERGTRLLTAIGRNGDVFADAERLAEFLAVPIEPDIVPFGLKRRI